MVYTAFPSNTINSTYYDNDNRNNLYHMKDGEYYKVTVNRSWLFSYTYTSDGGLSVSSSESNSVPNFGALGPLYRGVVGTDVSTYEYTYSYTDASNITQIIGTSLVKIEFYEPYPISKKHGSYNAPIS